MRPLERGPLRRGGPSDPADLHALLEESRQRVVGMARRTCSCEADVEDVLQEVHLAVVRTIDRFDDTRSFQAWLLGIARKKILDRRRKAGRSMPLEVEQVDVAVDSDEPLEREELWQVVLRAVQRLPSIYRAVIELHYLEGLPLHDVALSLGREPNTVRTQQTRAIHLLRQALPASLGR